MGGKRCHTAEKQRREVGHHVAAFFGVVGVVNAQANDLARLGHAGQELYLRHINHCSRRRGQLGLREQTGLRMRQSNEGVEILWRVGQAVGYVAQAVWTHQAVVDLLVMKVACNSHIRVCSWIDNLLFYRLKFIYTNFIDKKSDKHRK